ncbi:MAG: serine/threonine-protein kinase [Nannocystaceae bacterium]
MTANEPADAVAIASTVPDSGPGLIRPAPVAKEEADVIGRYSILSLLGEGGMGRVYAAFDDQLDRRVALKVLKGAHSGDASERIVREAQAMARLSHPNVVTVYEAADHHGELFVAMEYIKGETLSDWGRGATRTWKDVLVAYIQAGRGLAAAHAEGLVHRDFKPHNAMIDADGRVRVLDFGLVARRGEATENESDASLVPPPQHAALDAPLTRTGAMMGTPAYMAPEQIMGGAIDHRSDQFSLCVSLWEALFGQRPFLANTRMELFTKVAQGRLDEPEPNEVPPRLRAVLERGLRAKAEERWPDMLALLEALEPFAPPTHRGIGRSLDALLASLIAAVVWAALASLLTLRPSVEKMLLFVVSFALLGGLSGTAVGFIVRANPSVDVRGRPRRWWRRVLGAWATLPALGFIGLIFVLTMIRELRDGLLLPLLALVVGMTMALVGVLVVLEGTLDRTRPLWRMSLVATLTGAAMLVPLSALAVWLGLARTLALMAPVVGTIATAAAVALARPVD